MDDVRAVTLDDLTEGDIGELLDGVMEAAEGAIVSEAAVMRTQVEFWSAGRVQAIPPAWQARARHIIKRRESREARLGPNELPDKEYF